MTNTTNVRNENPRNNVTHTTEYITHGTSKTYVHERKPLSGMGLDETYEHQSLWFIFSHTARARSYHFVTSTRPQQKHGWWVPESETCSMEFSIYYLNPRNLSKDMPPDLQKVRNHNTNLDFNTKICL